MSGGSHEREDGDWQCKHCGLWFSPAGLHNHEETCKFAPVDHRVLELVDQHARERADDVDVADVQGVDDDRDDDHDAGAGEVDLEDDVDVPDAPDMDPDPAPDAPEGRPEGAPEATTRTDGGPQELPDGFEDAVGEDDLETDDGDGDPEPCPEHGTEESAPIEEFPALLEANPRLERFDRICLPCSTDEEGRAVSPVEVW